MSKGTFPEQPIRPPVANHETAENMDDESVVSGLRDRIALEALKALICEYGDIIGRYPAAAAKQSYALADAMLFARAASACDPDQQPNSLEFPFPDGADGWQP